MTWLDTKDAAAVENAVQELASREGPHAEAIRDYVGGDLRFGVWMQLVSQRIFTVTTLGVFDLEDWRWRDSYDAGESPRDAVQEFLEEFGYGEDQ